MSSVDFGVPDFCFWISDPDTCANLCFPMRRYRSWVHGLTTTYTALGSPRGLVSRFKTFQGGRCHGRGREFESRRPRHSFQRVIGRGTEPSTDGKRSVCPPFSSPCFRSNRKSDRKAANTSQRQFTRGAAFVATKATAACPAPILSSLTCLLLTSF